MRTSINVMGQEISSMSCHMTWFFTLINDKSMHKIILMLTMSVLCVISTQSSANSPQSTVPLDLTSRSKYYHVNYVLNDDATLVETRESSTTVLKPQALDWVKHASVSYSTSVQKAEVLEAYTLKADGRRIDVPKDNYQVHINKGREEGGPVFSDYSTLSVVFPDLAVNDSVVFSYRIVQTEAIFPKHFSMTEVFSRQLAVDDARVRVDYPESLWVQYKAREMQENVSSPAPGRKLVEWTFTNPKPLKSERRDYSVYDPDKEVGVSFSTFRDYAEIAAAYGERALPKAELTERIKEKAAEIAGGQSDPREQARVIYEWVATKITYGGNCVGVGTVVPHNLSFVLDNKMGDCKDHATLLQALLAARGIDAKQVLINSGSVYELPMIPVVSNVNHVINYLPAFDLYLDSTSDSTPFGMLPRGDRGKPVLHVGQYIEGAHTPTPKKASTQKMLSKIKISEDGTASGSIEAFMKGDAAVVFREWARNLTKEVEGDLIKDFFRSQGIVGSGRFEKDDPTALSDDYHFKITIDKAEKYLKLTAGGAYFISPLFGGSSVQSMVASSVGQDEEDEIACTNGSALEEYVIEFPRKMKILSIPKNFKITSKVQSYKARYDLKGRILTAQRSFEDNTPTSVCSPEIVAQYGELGEKVSENLKTPVLYQ